MPHYNNKTNQSAYQKAPPNSKISPSPILRQKKKQTTIFFQIRNYHTSYFPNCNQKPKYSA